MIKFLKVLGAVILLLILSVAAWLWTPSGAKIDEAAIKAEAAKYDVRIIRDNWGVPHIFGKTDADTSFGLAYAQAEDDWLNMEEALMSARGMMGQFRGKDSAPQDYLVDLFKVHEAAKEKYMTLEPATRALAEGYATGINLFAISNPDKINKALLPVSGQDIIAGFTFKTPFFYRMDGILGELMSAKEQPDVSPWSEGNNAFGLPKAVRGSNGFAVAPSRSTDGHTRVIVNSHQPFNGPYAWYEAHTVSEEGLNLAGANFPGTPILTQGVTPHHGWTHTVNQPDLVDIYALIVDDDAKPAKYKLDGEWREFIRSKSSFRVKLFGPFSLPITRDILWSEHGPVLSTPTGHYALRFAGLQDVRHLQQWYHMGKATNLEEWKAALTENGVLSFNIIYGDKDGNIGSIYNARMPKRIEGPDWKKVLPGDRSDLIWDEFVPVSELPQIWNPESGWLFSANSEPFSITDSAENQRREDFSETFGIEYRMTNRAMRAIAQFESDSAISEAELLAYREDANYEAEFRLRTMLDGLAQADLGDNEDIKEAQRILKAWDGGAQMDNRGTALAVLTGIRAYGYEFIDNVGEPEEALRDTITELKTAFGRLDPEWGVLNRIQRGDVDLPLNGGPDTLRAIYPDNTKILETKKMNAFAGDTHIMYADWDEDGNVEVKSIHQYGSATLDENSLHYDDQAVLFAKEGYKAIPMTLEAVLPLATRDYRPGK